jgi:hypothetical protein
MVIKETVVVDVDMVEKNYRGQGERTHNSYKRNAHFHRKWNHTEVKQMKIKVYRINLQRTIKINVTGVV